MIDLVRMGELGPLRHGLTRAAIRDILGPSQQWGPEKFVDLAMIWRYGDIEFYFKDGLLSWIFSDHENLTDGGETLKVESWVVCRGLELKEFECHLKNAEVGFTVEIPHYDSTQTHVICTSGARFTFLNETADGESGLVSWSTQT